MKRSAYAAVGFLALVTVGACSHSPGSTSAAGGALDRAAAPAERAPAAAPSKAAVAGTGRTADNLSAQLPLDGTFKIRTAQLTVAVRGARNVTAKADAAIAIAQRVGGEVEADNRTSGRYASASMQLRVPPEDLQPTLSALSKLGHARNRQLSTNDVTQRVADVDSRVASAQKSINRLRDLYEKAQKVATIVEIEAQLSARESDLESLQAQQRALAQQTSKATINLSLVTARKHVVPPKPEHHRGGFLGGLERGWDGFTAAASWVAGALGTLLPFLVLLVVLLVGARVLGLRLPRRRPAPPEPHGAA